jgi:hypothetical protein
MVEEFPSYGDIEEEKLQDLMAELLAIRYGEKNGSEEDILAKIKELRNSDLGKIRITGHQMEGKYSSQEDA